MINIFAALIRLFAAVLLFFTVSIPAEALAIECYQCHGTKIDDTSGDYRPLDDSVRNPLTGGFQGSHRRHMSEGATPSACEACHPGSGSYQSDHRNGLISVSFTRPAIYGNHSSPFPQRPDQAPGRCSNVSCHSDGTSVATGVASSLTPVWGSSGQLCSACHSNPPAYKNHSSKANAHQRHTAYSCNFCHYGTTSDGISITDPNLHANGAYDLSDPYGWYFSYSFAAAGGSCSNIVCHTDGTEVVTENWVYRSANWGDSGKCTGCHSYPPNYANGSPKANKHQMHQFSCNRCHYSTTSNGTSITGQGYHRNWNYDISGPPGETSMYYNGSWCVNSYCHSNGTGVTTGTVSNNSSPGWGAAPSPLTCTSCHAYPPAYSKGSPKSNTHLLHNSYGYKCSQCHYATTQNGTSLTAGGNSHLNHAYDISGPPDKPLTYSFSSTGGSCGNSYCHSTGQGKVNPADPPVYATPTWDQKRTVRCRMCHKAGYHAYDSFMMDTGSHYKHIQFESTLSTCKLCHFTERYSGIGSCGECHNSGTTTIGSGIYTDFSPRGPEHANGVVDVRFMPTYPDLGSTVNWQYTGDSVPGTAYGSCRNVYCHSKGTRNQPPFEFGNISTVKWGAGPLPVDCTGCHGGDLASSSPITTKSHGKHLGQDCNKCHADTAYNSRSAKPNRPLSDMYQMYSKGSYHTDGYVEVNFNNTTTAIGGKYAGQTATINRLPGAATGRCNNVYCHTNGVVVVTGGSFGNISTPLWGTTGRLNCGSCHGNPPANYDGHPKANAHQKHTSDCKQCHYQTTADNVTINNRAKHAQHRYELSSAPGTSFIYTFAANGSSCSNVSCHSNGGASRDWGTSCIHCHGNPPTPGGHQRSHLAYGCQNCHYSVTSNGNWITNTALHNNGRKTISAGPGVTFTNLSTMTNYCSNVSCHNDGTKVATGQLHNSGYGSTWWNATATLSCSACHRDRSYWSVYDYPNGSPKANSHQKHSGTNRISCVYCHASTMDGGGNLLAGHKNGQYDLKAYYSRINFAYTYATSTDHKLGGTCANIYCHGDGTAVTTNLPVTATATWGGASLACNSCHGYPPAYTSSNPKVNGHMGKHLPYSCDKCHYGFPSGHTDGSYNVSPGNYLRMTYTKSYYSTCSNVSCHGDGTSTTTYIAPVNGPLQWGATQSFSCTSCHAMPPAYPDRSPKVNAHGSHTSYGCQVCHFNITPDGLTISDKSRHANGYYNISSNGSNPFRFTFGYKGSSCSDISCHAAGAKQRNWTYQPLDLNYVIPSADSTGNNVTTPVQLVFFEPVDMNTVNENSFYLKQGETPVAGNYSYSNLGENYYLVSFTPTQPLQYFTTYTTTFTNDIKAATGVNVSTGRTWSFATGHSPQYGAVLTQEFPSPFDLSPFAVAKGSWVPDYYVSKTYMNGVWATSAETSVAESVLQTPQIDLSIYKTVMLQFSYNLKYTAPNAAYVDVSTNGISGPWTTIWSKADPLAAGVTEGSYSETLDLSSLIKYQPNVMLRFRFNVTQVPQANQGAFSVDNIYLYADPN
ncbi:CxxxxCH/CxxCH domain-containing protein [Geobacter pelophilus]|uniref:CxxxxCH/CxxCH domain-containing protein n=1 Tax=Geoanaerobacter pelophilus TaxID=60036 RepID=A0AAW4L0Z8_9BACT|nr:CxxxxCH/CxxCH domain-containing protein [Geoanaerobacter pelophilus]MBT0663480.1 CxxxxCH/CxxCH domain-containing protein [Geoanaerobacter pelophilus]